MSKMFAEPRLPPLATLCRRKRLPCLLLVAFALIGQGHGAVSHAVTQPERVPADAPPAVAELLALLQKAPRQSALADYEHRRLENEHARLSLTTTLDPSSLELQTEGLGDSFGREDNAMDTVGLLKPIYAPWQTGARRNALEALAEWRDAEGELTGVDVAGRIAQLWSTWAEIEARIAVRSERLERIDRALEIFEQRLTLGEVAGTEVRQLEAQRAEDRVALVNERLSGDEHRLALEALLGFAPPVPAGDSLSQMESWLSGTQLSDEVSADSSSTAQNPRRATIEAPRQAGRIEARAELEQSLAQLELETAAGTPRFGIELERVPSFADAPSIEAMGLQLSIPLPFGRSVRQRRSAARSSAALAESRRQRAVLDLERDLATWQSRLASASLGLRDVETVMERLPRTEFSLSEQFRLGAISYLVFLDGVARLDDIRLRQIELQGLAVRARIELSRLSGDNLYFPLPSPSEVKNPESLP